MNKLRRGFSLLELLMALTVFTLFLTGVFRLLGSSGQKMALSSEVFAAIQISSKVRAEIDEEARLNPTFLELVHEVPDITDCQTVRDGQSYYFRWGADRAAPYGKITEADGPAIVPEDGSIYNLLNNFRVQLDVQRVEAPSAKVPGSHQCLTTIIVDWKDKTGRRHDYQLPSRIFSPSGRAIPESLLVEETALRGLIREYLFPGDTSSTLEQAVSNSGADLDLAFHAGRVGVMTEQLSKAIDVINSDLVLMNQQRKTLIPQPDWRLAKLQLNIARRTEEGASLLYNAIAECQDSMEFLDREGSSGRLGSLPFGPYSRGLKSYEALSNAIVDWIEEAGKAYEWLLQDGLQLYVAGRDREFACNKRLETFRLLLLLKPAAAADFQKFLDKEKNRVDGVNPYLFRLFTRESVLRTTPQRYAEVFPNLQEIYQRITQVIKPFGKKVPELLARHPEGGQS